ncbi:uncharacterized protein LOC134191450 [Corticium candelabrum]|uniref:uncharacterized protein LOC134191450 n=1 Tax=Corticium candelabrum TaxID=121492 RepID=UPI002E25A6FD|nr:uncharacterized protein LOC134191450 [Corticium candelabrum]
MALLADLLGLLNETTGTENGFLGPSNFSMSQPIAIPSQCCWTENAAKTSSYGAPYHSLYPSAWEGDTTDLGSCQFSSDAQNYSQLQFYDCSAHAWGDQEDVAKPTYQHQGSQNQFSSSLGGSEDSYSSQSLNAQTVYGSYDEEYLDDVFHTLQESPPLQLQRVQTTAPDDIVNEEVSLTDLDMAMLTDTIFSSDVEASTFHSAYEQSASNDVFYGSSYLFNSHNCTPELTVKVPTIRVISQPPKAHRARYEKEAEAGSKGLLKTESKEPISIQLDNVAKGTGDLTVTISAVTLTGVKHPYIAPSCFGRGMPSSWKRDATNRTVSTVLRESEGYRKSLSFLGIKRNKLENIDLRSHKKEMLAQFCLKFEIAVPFGSGYITRATATTEPVRILCPSTATKLRKMSE